MSDIEYGWYLDGYELGGRSSLDLYAVIQMAVEHAATYVPWHIDRVCVGLIEEVSGQKICRGSYVLPVEHDGAEWRPGGVVDHPRASVSPKVDDALKVRWEWGALGPSQTHHDEPTRGTAATLAEAMGAAGRIMRGEE